MDRRNWPWRKKSSEKVAAVVEQGNTLLAQLSRAYDEQDVIRNGPDNSDEVVTPLEQDDKVKNLNERLSAALTESNAKDDLVKQHAKVAEEAVSGWEKAEAEANCLKEELDVALQQKLAAEDRVSHLDGALKECMRQLRQVREEQEQSIHDAVMKKARELALVQIELEETLAETRQQLLEARGENGVIHKSLQERTRSLEEMSNGKDHAEAEVNALKVRLDSLEAENAAMKYELHVLDKELEIRNEEREYNRRSADASNKQHLESMKKIAKLETECQRLRILVRKRLPGPAAVAQMKMEVESLGKETIEWKRKKMYVGEGAQFVGSSVGEALYDGAQDNSIKQMNVLSKRLLAMEEETEILKAALTKRSSELQASRAMCARTAGKLSQVEAQLDALSRVHDIGRGSCMVVDGHVETPRGMGMSYEPSLASISEDGGNEDEASCAESWASALISELAQFKKKKPAIPTNKVLESPGFDLMDDFVEMERLAIISSENAVQPVTLSGNTEEKLEEPRDLKTGQTNNGFSVMERKDSSEVTSADRELKPLLLDNHTDVEQQLSTFQSRSLVNVVDFARLQELLGMVLEAHTKRQNMDEVLEKVKVAITKSQHSAAQQVNKTKERLSSLKGSIADGLNNEPFQGIVSDAFSPRSSSEENSSSEEMGTFSSCRETKDSSHGSKLNASIQKILGLIEGFVQSTLLDCGHSQSLKQITSGYPLFGNSTTVPGYTVRVLQWQNSEFDSVIQSLVKVCSDLIQGKADMVQFAEEVASALNWLVNHFFSLQDVSSMRATIKKRLEWEDESHSGSESEALDANSLSATLGKANEVVKGPYENGSLTSTQATVVPEVNTPTPNVIDQLEEAQKLLSEKEVLECQLNIEIRKLKDDLTCVRSEKEELEKMLQLANKSLEAIKLQLQETEQKIVNLQTELTVTKESMHVMEDQIENHMSMNEELDYQLKAAGIELKQAQEKFTSLQAEFEEKGNCCQELEATCLDLQLQLVSGGKCDTPREEKSAVVCYSAGEDEIRLRKEREISAATKKLAECQQTILVLGKQLQALSLPSDAKDGSIQPSADLPLVEKIIPSTSQRASLFDHIQAENKTEESQDCLMESPKTKEVLWPKKEGNSQQELIVPRNRKTGLLYGWQRPMDSPNIDVHDNIEYQMSGGSYLTDTTGTSSVKSPVKFFNNRNKNSESNSSKSSGGEAGPSSPKRRSHGGFTRFLMRTRKGH